jgi:2,4-dienoyl-CoA reductase-like NADH-dependent reductase (Old Yellow Enzyme family)
LSPHTNRRTDEYGGSSENRMRFILEIIRGIRSLCGPDFPIVVRLAVDVRSNDKLALELGPHFARLYTFGDARKVGRIAQAVRDRFDTAWNMT